MRWWQSVSGWLTDPDLRDDFFSRMAVTGVSAAFGLIWRKLWRSRFLRSATEVSVESWEVDERLLDELIEFQSDVDAYVLAQLEQAAMGSLPTCSPSVETLCESVVDRTFSMRREQLIRLPSRPESEAHRDIIKCARSAVMREVAIQWAVRYRATPADEWIAFLRRQGPAS
jgi:hypothetical protein